MNKLLDAVRAYFHDLASAWNSFWFAPADPATLCLIRVLAGAMLLYTHLVWSKDLTAFFGADGWLPTELVDYRMSGRWLFSYFDFIEAPALLWTIHVANLIVFFCLMIGFFSRTAAVLAFISTIAYVARVFPGAYFGLDVVNCVLAMYVMLGPCGDRYSVDALLRLRRHGVRPIVPSVSANLALRLLQLHMCVIYFYSAYGKLQGTQWFNGAAVWFTVANVEYRSLDMTWIANHLWIGEFLTHATVFFELFYWLLIWNRFSRPWVLMAAVGVHGFIGLCLGMLTFASAMLIGNVAFIPARFITQLFERPSGWVASKVVPGGGAVSGGDKSGQGRGTGSAANA